MAKVTDGVLLEPIRDHVTQDLPAQAMVVLAQYQSFLAQEPPVDAKAFGAHFSAAKAALAHLEVLIRLIQWAEADTLKSDAEITDPNAEYVAQARAAIAAQWSAQTSEEDQDD